MACERGSRTADGLPLVAAPLPSRTPFAAAAERTSDFVMLPAGPLPDTAARSTPSAAAARAATGETFAPSGAGACAGGSATGDAYPSALLAWPRPSVFVEGGRA